MEHLSAQHQDAVVSLCRNFHVQRLELFGSAAGTDFDPEHSDLDFLVQFESMPPGEYASAFFSFREALEQLFGRPVDLVVDASIRNPYFRRTVDMNKALLYAA